jgi:hypothetical protein
MGASNLFPIKYFYNTIVAMDAVAFVFFKSIIPGNCVSHSPRNYALLPVI